jgi:tRNA A37 threonylcarbamoyladenosine synthetase subunit TsaC/SUA5/YrdC
MKNNFSELFIATTDTVLGLGAPVSEKNRIAIFDIKKRSLNKKLIIMISNYDQLEEFEG